MGGNGERGERRPKGKGLKSLRRAKVLLIPGTLSLFLVPQVSLDFPRVCWLQQGAVIESRTRESIALEAEVLQVRQAADRLGNCACTPRERATGTIRERSSFPSSRSPVLSSLSLV